MAAECLVSGPLAALLAACIPHQSMPRSIHSPLLLLCPGAKRHGLAPDYVQYLESLHAYDSSAWGRQAGKFVAGAVMLSLASPVLPLVALSRLAAGPYQPAPPPRGLEDSSSGDVAEVVVPQSVKEHEASGGSGTGGVGAGNGSRNSKSSSSASSDGDRAGADGGLSSSVAPYVSWYFHNASRLCWWAHDVAMAPVLGSGCSNGE